MRILAVHALAAVLALQTLAGTARADPVRSGPQAGEEVPGAFKVLNINGPEAGQKACLYCRYGPRPVVMIFAREVSPALLTLIQRLETVTAASAASVDESLGSCVIVCSDSESLPGQLTGLAQQMQLKHLVLAVSKATGPASYHISPEAEVTILLYRRAKVLANYGFRKGEFTAQHVEPLLAVVNQMLAAK
jgi:hypothetical protein